MIPDKNTSRRGLPWSVCLLLALVLFWPAQLSAGAGGEGFDPTAVTSTSIEGLVKSMAADTWLVDQTTVRINAATAIVELGGTREVGAWVVIWGVRTPEYLTAETIHILRPAGAPMPLSQFTGLVSKIQKPYLLVGETLVTVPDALLAATHPAINDLVSVQARRDSRDWVAQQIEVLVPAGTQAPVQIEGTVEQATEAEWVIDGRSISLVEKPGEDANQGDRAEVEARIADDGRLIAESTRIVDPATETKLDVYVVGFAGVGTESQTWNVIIFEDGRSEHGTVRVSSDTYVDEDRAVLATEIEAVIDGNRLAGHEIAANLAWLEQPPSVIVAGTLTEGMAGTLPQINGHPVWFRTEQVRQQALAESRIDPLASAQGAGEVVLRGVQLRNGVVVAHEVLQGAAALEAMKSALAPASVAGAMSTWSAPAPIVSELPKATKPTLLFAPDRTAHMVFESLGIIYHASQTPGTSWGTPRKIATGVSPTAILDAQGRLHVVYINEFMGNYDVYHVRLTSSGWTAPVYAAYTSGRSADPAIVADDGGKIHLAWMDNTSGSWAIHTGSWNGLHWTSSPVTNGRGQSPALAISPQQTLVLAWQDRVPTGVDTWGHFDIYQSERKDGFWGLPVNVSVNASFSPGVDAIGVSMVVTSDGLIHLAWCNDEQQIRYNMGRGLYWPRPVDVSVRRELIRGLDLRLGNDGLLYLAWDEGTRVSVTAAAPNSQVWPGARLMATQPGLFSDVSLTNATGGVVLTWVYQAQAGPAAVYESVSGMVNPIKLWLTSITRS